MLALLCTACTEKPLTNQETQNLLSQYTWVYTAPNSDIPIELTFKDDQLGAYTSCNSMGGAYKIIEQKMLAPIIFGDAQACAPHIMQQEHFIRMFFYSPFPLRLAHVQVNIPNLFFKKISKNISLSAQNVHIKIKMRMENRS